MPKRKPLILEDFLPYRISLLSNTISGAIARTYQDKFGMSMAEWRIMCILAEYPGISADAVCQRTRIEKSVVSRAVARLLKRKLLNRSFAKSDKRRSCLHLSATGLGVYDEVMPIAKSYEKKLIKRLTKQERQNLSRLLTKLQEVAAAIGDASAT